MKISFKDKITYFINRTFRDEIIAVEPPREMWVEYKDVGRRLEGYVVPVTYKYRGKQTIYSCIDNDHLCLVSPQRALKFATDFYNNARQKILERQSK